MREAVHIMLLTTQSDWEWLRLKPAHYGSFVQAKASTNTNGQSSSGKHKRTPLANIEGWGHDGRDALFRVLHEKVRHIIKYVLCSRDRAHLPSYYRQFLGINFAFWMTSSEKCFLKTERKGHTPKKSGNLGLCACTDTTIPVWRAWFALRPLPYLPKLSRSYNSRQNRRLSRKATFCTWPHLAYHSRSHTDASI